jgi:hypothetical protein
MQICGRQVRVEVKGEQKIKDVYVTYATEKLDRMGNFVPFEEGVAEKTADGYIFTLPEGATACLARYLTEEDVTFSTDVEILG